MIVPVILAGGEGSRLWPLSRKTYPKQFLSLVGENSMLQETVLRVRKISNSAPPFTICHESHRFIVAEQLQAIGVKNPKIMLEPISKNTAPAAMMAALYFQSSDPILLVLPADHLIKDHDVFTKIIGEAANSIVSDELITFGITPTYPETGYGYIQTKAAKNWGSGYRVEKFIEKPLFHQAELFIESGNYFWNSGMFMFRASSFLKAMKMFSPGIANSCEYAFENLINDLDFIRINELMFSQCKVESIDTAVMEKTADAVVFPLKAQWSDIGSWSSLWDARDHGKDGNFLHGDVLIEKVNNSYIHAENRLLAVVGVDDHIVVETTDAVLVANKKYCQDVKKIVLRMKEMQRKEIDSHRKVYRPWGYYEVLCNDRSFQVKRIIVKPGASLSLQMHHFRSEHWVVIKGTAQVTCGERVFEVKENESTFISKKTKHRLTNLSDLILEIIEIQMGEYLGEDDIVRFEDVYGRMKKDPTLVD